MQLDLSRKGYAYIPEDLEERLTSLTLSSNRIHSLSDLGRLVNLRRVDLSSNKIVSLAGIEVLGALVWLNVSRNSITSLDGLQHIVHLETLDVSDNNLTDIDTLEHNMSLTHLNASINCINLWPRFSSLVNLEVLNLNDNQLPAFRLLHTVLPPRVHQVHLARNCIDHLHCFDSCRLQPMTSLHTLDLAGNDCAANSVIAMATLSSIFPSLTTLDGQPVKPSPPPLVSHDGDLDVSNRDVKIQMWKQMLQQRSQQENLERLRLQQERQVAADTTRPPSNQIRPPAAPLPRYFANHSIATNVPPSPASLTSTPRSASGEAPLSYSSTFLPHNESTALTTSTKPNKGDSSRHELRSEVAALQEHVQHMRKYMKVWVKREQWLRVKSATCIQKFYRGHLARVKYSRPPKAAPLPASPTHPADPTAWNVHTSSGLIEWPAIPQDVRVFHVYAQLIQKIVRGWLIRRRFVWWKRVHLGASQIQRVWRGHVVRTKHFWIRGNKTPSAVSTTLLRHLQRVSFRVGKLERQVVIQDEATAALWSQIQEMQAASDRLNQRKLSRAVVRLQAAWRGQAGRKQARLQRLGQSQRQQFVPRDAEACKQCRANAAELASLRQQLDELTTFVRQLTLPPPVSPEVEPRGDSSTSLHTCPDAFTSPDDLPTTASQIDSPPLMPFAVATDARPLSLADFFAQPTLTQTHEAPQDVEVFHSVEGIQVAVAASIPRQETALLE